MRFEYLIIAGGKLPPIFFVKKLLNLCTNIITIDRGAHLALKLKIKPLLHIGDHDSFSKTLLKKLKSKAVIHLDPKKSISDLEYALQFFSPILKPILVIGAHSMFEDRYDHSFINMILLQSSHHIYYADEKNWMTTIEAGKTISFLSKRGTLFSLVTINKKRNRVKISGAKYEGKINLARTSHGLSNVAKGHVRIKTEFKTLLFVSSDLTQTKIDDSRFPR